MIFFVLCALGVSLIYLNNKIYLEIGLIGLSIIYLWAQSKPVKLTCLVLPILASFIINEYLPLTKTELLIGFPSGQLFNLHCRFYICYLLLYTMAAAKSSFIVEIHFTIITVLALT